jgi:hypothetical protein
VIEWFPDHSAKAGLPNKPICPSQEYSFELARKALGQKLIVGMRARKMWAKVDPRFGKIPYLKNPQCGAVSVGNTPDGLFDAIVEALRKRVVEFVGIFHTLCNDEQFTARPAALYLPTKRL